MDTIHSSHSWLVYHYGKAVLWKSSFAIAVKLYRLFFCAVNLIQIAGTWDDEISKWKQLYCGVEFSLLPAVRFLPLPKWTQWGGPTPQMLISHVLFLMFYPQMIKFPVYDSSLSSKSYLGRFLWSTFNWSSSTRTQIYFIKVKVHWGYFPFFPSVTKTCQKSPTLYYNW